MKIGRQSLWTLTSQILGAGFLLASSILVSRLLGSAGQGIFTLLSVSVNILLLVVNLGLDMAYMHIASRQQSKISSLIIHAIMASLLLGFIGAIIAYTVLTMNDFNRSLGCIFCKWTVFALPFALLSSFLGGIYLGLGKIWVYNVINLSRPTILLMSLIILFLYQQLSTDTIVLAFVASLVLPSIFALTAIQLVFPKDKAKNDFAITRDCVSFGSRVYVANIISYAYQRFDTFLVGYFIGASGVGWYSIAVNFTDLLSYIPTALGTVILPKVALLPEDDKIRLTESVCRMVFWLAALGGACLSVLAPFIIPIFFGDHFAPSISALWFLIPGAIMLSLSKIISFILLGLGKPGYASYNSIFTMIVITGLDIVMIPKYGINGAAMASSLAYTFSAIFLIACISKETSITWFRLFLLLPVRFQIQKPRP